MMLSVMVVGAGAAFSDQSKIKNTEAVDMCTALNIIGGYPDGTFKPEGNITRAEVTKMICVALNGGKEPNVGTNATPTFSDVRTNANSAWAEGYIESCYAQGIVSGVGGGKFAPAGNVTATQMAKMLLVALGYNADNEGFTGNAWATNVNVRASQKGLYEDLENIDVNAALTRDNAAQMIWNALNAYEVEYKTTLITDSKGQLTSQITVQDKLVQGTKGFVKITLLEDKYESNTATGMMTDAKWNDTTKKYEYTISFDENNSGTPSEVKSTADYSDLFGMDVKVVYSKDKKSNDIKVYGIVADDSSVIAQGVVGQLELNSAATDKKIKLDGTSYDLDFAANAIDCYLTNGQKAQSKLSEQMIASQDAWTVKLLDTDANNKVDRAVLTKVSVQKITYANSTGIRVGSTAYDFDDHNIYKGAAKDDWAIIVDKDYTVDEKAAITKADVVSGKVQSVKSDNSVRLNGTWYDKAPSYTGDNTTPTISSKVDLVVYGGMYFDTDASTTALDVAVVTGIGTYDKMNETTPVRLMFKDGKEEIVNVEKWDSNEKDAVTGSKDVLVSYDIDDDDYTLTTVAQNTKVGDSDYKGYVDLTTTSTTCSTTYDKDKAAIVKAGTPKATYYDIAKDAMVVIKNSDDKYVYMTGEQLLSRNDLTFTNVYAAIDENEVGALFATTGSSVTTGDKLYGYITEINTQLNGEDKQKVYIDVIINGEKKENVETDKKAVGSFKVGDVISYTMDGDVMCITKESNVNTRAAIKEFNASRVLFYDYDDQGSLASTTTRKLLTKDTVIIAIDSDDKDNVVYAGNALVAANAKTFNNGVASAYYNNALYYANNDGEIEVIIVEVDDATEFVAPASTPAP